MEIEFGISVIEWMVVYFTDTGIKYFGDRNTHQEVEF